MQTSNYHFVMDNYFKSPALFMHLSAMGVAAAGTVRVSQLENTPLQDMVKNEQREVWIINCGY